MCGIISVIFILLYIWQNCVCFGDFLPMKTLCDAYHKEFESHKGSILDISARVSTCPEEAPMRDFAPKRTDD